MRLSQRLSNGVHGTVSFRHFFVFEIQGGFNELANFKQKYKELFL